jgi:hypothetical protein
MVMKSMNLTHPAISAALFVTFAGVLFSQTAEKNHQSGEATQELMAANIRLDTVRYERPEEGMSKEASPSSPGTLGIPKTSVDPMLTLPKFNIVTWVPEKTPAHGSFVRVEPDVLPLNVRLDPTALTTYGAAPAVMRLSFGRK